MQLLLSSEERQKILDTASEESSLSTWGYLTPITMLVLAKNANILLKDTNRDDKKRLRIEKCHTSVGTSSPCVPFTPTVQDLSRVL